MNKENIILNINDLKEKIKTLDERLFVEGEEASSLDLDTQLMYLRLMYDSYLSLKRYVKPVGKGKEKIKNKVENCVEEPASEEEKDIATLPLPFMDEAEQSDVDRRQPMESEAKKTEEPETKLIESEEVKVENPESEPQMEDNIQENEVEVPGTEDNARESEAEVPETKPEEPKEEGELEPETKPEEPEEEGELEPETKLEEPEATENEVTQEPAIDLTEYETPITEFDMDAIEFELEDDEDLEDLHSKQSHNQEDYPNYYPGLNPRAMNGELDDTSAYATRGTTSLGEHFANQFPSLNDQLSQKRGEKVFGERLQKEQITDLTKSIDLNVKFLFIKELFKGDASLLTSELQNLNRCQHLENALAYFEDMKLKYHWKEENEAVDKLYELILRKYAK